MPVSHMPPTLHRQAGGDGGVVGGAGGAARPPSRPGFSTTMSAAPSAAARADVADGADRLVEGDRQPGRAAAERGVADEVVGGQRLLEVVEAEAVERRRRRRRRASRWRRPTPSRPAGGASAGRHRAGRDLQLDVPVRARARRGSSMPERERGLDRGPACRRATPPATRRPAGTGRRARRTRPPPTPSASPCTAGIVPTATVTPGDRQALAQHGLAGVGVLVPVAGRVLGGALAPALLAVRRPRPGPAAAGVPRPRPRPSAPGGTNRRSTRCSSTARTGSDPRSASGVGPGTGHVPASSATTGATASHGLALHARSS